MTIRPQFVLFFILFVILGVYYPTIFAPFNSVDDHTLINMLINQEEHSLVNLFLPKTSGYYYRPLLIVTFWLDKWLWGLHESFMHLGNILLHAMNALLVYAIAVRLSSKSRHASMIAGAAALLFSLHPLNTEAVNWISGRTDLLAGFFILASTWFLLAALEKPNFMLMIVAALAMTVACLAKETAIFFLPAALFMIYCRGRSADQAGKLFSGWNCAGYAAFIAAGCTYFAIRSMALSKGDVGVRHAAGQMTESSIDYLYLARVSVKVGGFYLKKLFYPWPLNFGITKVPDYYLFMGVLLLIIIAYLLYRRDLISSFFFAGICIGSSSLIVAFGRMAWTPIAERYMYIPSAFMIIGATVLISSRVDAKSHAARASSLLVIVMLAVFAVSTTLRNITWQDNLTLFSDTVEKSPDFIPARNDKAIALIQKGHKQEGQKIIKELDATASLKNWELADLNKAGVLVTEGKIDEARKVVGPIASNKGRNQRRAIEFLLQVDEKMLAKADPKSATEIRKDMVGHLETLQKLTGSPFYYYRLGQAYLALNNREDAQKMFEKAYLNAPATAHYREPAGKLSKSLLK